MDELERQQRVNETAKHRVVGLVIETRPDAVTPQALKLIRRLGCTKIQMGIQSLDQHLLDINERRISVAQIEQAFSLARLFGFKIHAHFMLNLLGATPEGDKRDYERFMTEGAFMPDESRSTRVRSLRVRVWWAAMSAASGVPIPRTSCSMCWPTTSW